MTQSPLAVLALCLILCLGSQASIAAPAPWYKWKSKLNGKLACMQTSPGDDGWTRDSGPYHDARCLPPPKPAQSAPR
jgi:hypothetical protein